jgi:hypothetical protein
MFTSMPDLQPFLLCFEKKRTVQRFPLVHTLFFTQQESSDLEEHQVLLLKQETDKMKVYFKKTSGPTRRGRLDISARYCEKWNRIFFFFCSAGVWTQGLHLEPLHQPFFVMGCFETESQELFAWTGFKPQSS